MRRPRAAPSCSSASAAQLTLFSRWTGTPGGRATAMASKTGPALAVAGRMRAPSFSRAVTSPTATTTVRSGAPAGSAASASRTTSAASSRVPVAWASRVPSRAQPRTRVSAGPRSTASTAPAAGPSPYTAAERPVPPEAVPEWAASRALSSSATAEDTVGLDRPARLASCGRVALPAPASTAKTALALSVRRGLPPRRLSQFSHGSRAAQWSSARCLLTHCTSLVNFLTNFTVLACRVRQKPVPGLR